MASLELLEGKGCGLQKIRQDLARSYKLCSPAISVGGAALAHGTAVCGTCANQTRAGELQPVQLRWDAHQRPPCAWDPVTTKTCRYVEAAFLWRVKTTHNTADN
jgi:hypothetical protein